MLHIFFVFPYNPFEMLQIYPTDGLKSYHQKSFTILLVMATPMAKHNLPTFYVFKGINFRGYDIIAHCL